MQDMIGKGPVTIMLVFSKTCPHCVTYMPIWKKLCATQGRKANMVSMEAQTYQKTPYASQKPVSGVPSVLYVNKAGEITEAKAPRDTTVMTNAVRVSPASDLPVSVIDSTSNVIVSANANAKPPTALANSNLFKVTESNRRTSSNREPVVAAPIAGTMSSENPLPTVPGAVVPSSPGPMVQQGGNPWAAFLIAAAQQAAPTAVLMGAYAALPARSSGLPAPSPSPSSSRNRKTRRQRS